MHHDPTAIADIRFDPLHQRMEGVALHGNTPFDMPFISEIDDNLWQGGCAKGLVMPSFVDHYVSLYPWESYRLNHHLESAMQVRMYDSLDDVNPEQVLHLARWVNLCRETGVVLVHCQAGLNRSALIAGTALVLGGMTPGDAIALMREKRSSAVLCNPNFEAWVRALA